MGEEIEMRPARMSASSLTDDLVLHGSTVVLVLQLHGAAEHDLAGARHAARIDDLRGAELRLELPDATLDEALLFAGRVIFRVLREVAVAPRLGDRLDHARACLGLEFLELGAQRFGATHRHGGAFHARMASL